MFTVENLSKTYGKHQALGGVSFEAQAGQVFGLLGPNGAGKTTLLRIASTLLEPSAGRVVVAGLDVTQKPAEVRRILGVVNGGMGLYERLTGREILHYFAGLYGMSKSATEERIAELDSLLDLGATLDKQAGGFSTGMAQKIVVARAVIHDPAVLILDEATSGLDIMARRNLLDFTARYRQSDKLVLYSTHIMSEAEELCDHMAIIDKGELLYLGSRQGVLEGTGERNLERAFFELVRGRAERGEAL